MRDGAEMSLPAAFTTSSNPIEFGTLLSRTTCTASPAGRYRQFFGSGRGAETLLVKHRYIVTRPPYSKLLPDTLEMYPRSLEFAK